MPPKTRGRGRGRGGTARGGHSDRPAQEPAAPEHENNSEAKEVPAPANDAPPVSVADADASQAPAPRQRLDTVAEPSSTSRSASPAVRRGRGKRGVIAAPTYTGRRSKAERDARNSQLAARDREKNQQREKEEARLKRMTDSRRNNTSSGRGRAYYGSVSGPFSDPSRRKDQRQNRSGFGGHGGSGAGSGSGSGSGSRATGVKSEGGAGGSHGVAWSSTSFGTSVKREEGGYISSEEEAEIAAFPRKDIDTIQLSSDENEDETKDMMALPVRIRRQEHRERVVGIKTEASVETPLKDLPKAEEGGAPLATTGPRASASKGKGKAKDLEIIGERKQYKGVWQDSEDSDMKIKTEPGSEDEAMPDADQPGHGISAVKAGKRPEHITGHERKPKARPTHGLEQTDEELAELERQQLNLNALRYELGPPVDGSEDVIMDNIKKPTARDDVTYLFQLPNILPDLQLPSAKKEAGDTAANNQPASASTASSMTIAASTSPAKADGKRPIPKSEPTPVKKEVEFSDPRTEAPAQRRFPSGYVGKLRVHQSGRTTLDWGGVSFDVTPGRDVGYVQEVVSLSIAHDAGLEPEADAGEAVSFGSIKGKFLVVPSRG